MIVADLTAGDPGYASTLRGGPETPGSEGSRNFLANA